MTAFRVINTSPKLAPSETLMDSDPAPLLRISMNNKITDAVRSELRRRPNHTEDIDELDDHTQLGTARPDFLSQIADRQAARAAIAELQRLIEDEPHNKDLFLAVFARLVDEPEALTQTEIADRFGMSQATVSRTLARLRSAMRDAASRHLDVPEES
jgi:RNA polymerase sigma factor (sigma-70 family)